MKRQRRAGATETFSVSVDPETKRRLRALAQAKFGGNVSALISDLAREGERTAEFERAWAWYGGAEPTPAESAGIVAEWEAGWALGRKPGKSKRGRAA